MDDKAGDSIAGPRPDRVGARLGNGTRVSERREPSAVARASRKSTSKKSKVRRVEHHAALPYGELAGFMVELRRQEGVAARALEFAILTTARTGEVLGATWAEIGLEGRLWTIPAERTEGRPRAPCPAQRPGAGDPGGVGRGAERASMSFPAPAPTGRCRICRC